jgi:hypothetical protein
VSTDTTHTVSDFVVGQSVRYIPNHAHNNPRHSDCENGVISSINETTVFVKFYRNGMTQHTAEGCDPTNLI